MSRVIFDDTDPFTFRRNSFMPTGVRDDIKWNNQRRKLPVEFDKGLLILMKLKIKLKPLARRVFLD